MSMTNRTIPLTDRQIFSLFVDVPTDVASLGGREVSAYLHHSLAVPFSFVCEHGNEIAPACICNRLSKTMVAFHTFDIQILNANGIISSYKGYRALMQVVSATISNLLVKPSNFEFLVFKPFAAFNLSGKMPLCPCKFVLISFCISVILENFPFGSDKQVFQPYVHSNRFASICEQCSIFLLSEYGNKILATWCFGDSNLTYFAFYLTMYTALDTLFELGNKKPVVGDISKLRNGKAVLRVLGLEVRKLRTLLKEIGIGYFETADSKLQGLGIYFFEPRCRILLLQGGESLCLRIIVIALACKPILLFALIEKVIVYKTSASEVPCQQLGLLPVRVQSKLVYSIYLSHIAYKGTKYFVNNQNLSYIYGMKENYNHESRHKYYLKCHLIFCIKYRRKILKGEFDDNIKAIFQSIADNSNFDIDIMETDKDHVHFLISYPPKLSVTSIVRKLKQESTVFVWHLYGSMLRKYFWREKTLWSDGYFVCSIGEAHPNTVIEYIRQQG